MIKLLKAIRTVLVALLILLGSCVHCLWANYKATDPDPCRRVGERMGLVDVHQHHPQGNGWPARCSGRRPGSRRYIQYRAGSARLR